MLNVSFSTAAPADMPLIVPVRAGAVPEKWRKQASIDGFDGADDTHCEILGKSRKHLLVGIGDPEQAGARAASRLLRHETIALDARDITASEAASMAAAICLRAWRYNSLRTRPIDDAPQLKTLLIVGDNPKLEKTWATLAAGIEATLFARDLVTEPANTLTPAGFVAHLGRLVQEGVTLDVLDAVALAEQGFGGLLAVGRASKNPPCLAILRWPGSHTAPPVAFVGKGITFDTGGISIKPADKMWEMRADMAGAAACAGAVLALALRHSPAPAIAVLPLAENTTGADSYRPGDVLKMLAGPTVQVVDTDAEGRLVLADALAYVAREKPQAIIDLATLTGSIVVALGHEMAGSYDNDPALAAAVSAAGAAVGERTWRMPIGERHRRDIDSDIADLKQCVDGRMQPDASHAAAFLREFVDDVPWVHLDIAGVESHAEADARHAKGATGFGVRLLDRLVADRFEDPHRV